MGVVKKCKAQVDAFREADFEVDDVMLGLDGIYWNGNKYLDSILLYKRWSSYFFYLLSLWSQLKANLPWQQYDFLYLRYALAHPGLLRFLHQIKSTYPYDAEPTALLHRLSLQLDRYYRQQLHQYVDLAIHYGLDTHIYQIPTLPIRNGIDLKTIPLSQSQPKPSHLRLIAMANWSYWHGLDRLLNGLVDYYRKDRKIEVSLKVIGDGSALESYRQLVAQARLEKVVTFHPPMIGEELDAAFDESDMGIGSLGVFRKGIPLDASLKHRAYCARGIPFILSTQDLDFPEDLGFVRYFPEEESPIDIEQLLEFSSACYAIPSLKVSMRSYAAQQLSWGKQLQGVFEWLKA